MAIKTAQSFATPMDSNNFQNYEAQAFYNARGGSPNRGEFRVLMAVVDMEEGSMDWEVDLVC